AHHLAALLRRGSGRDGGRDGGLRSGRLHALYVGAGDEGVERTVEDLRPGIVIGDDGEHAALRHAHALRAGGTGLIDVGILGSDRGGERLADDLAALLRRGGRGGG